MTSSRFGSPSPSHAGQAARACIDRLTVGNPATPARSPLFTVMEIANTLELERSVANQAWVVRNNARQGASTRISAWPLRFSRDTREKPLLYLHSAHSSAQLCAVSAESARRGIFCNDNETLTTSWPKGADPSLPLWLANNPDCLPFDPASGDETRAIVLDALHRLYVEGQPGFYYLALHDHEQGPRLGAQDRGDALQGMYKVAESGPLDASLRVRLLGAGQAFEEVRQAAALLEQDWGVASQLWSCPSYTRLAREAAAAERWNRLHPEAAKRSAHLMRCLGHSRDPVLAVTGYGQAVTDQLRGFVKARFVALGAGSATARSPSRQWIATLALKALADEQRLPTAKVKQALQRYGLR
ncbi:transketolase-like TK C-terminal-containing protein [Pseudomonas sp. QD4]|uniref:transketolase-like TK C-terminal-containing protein n=1 Tax=Pseudomonas sp. QD4 TaxID=3368618 RepID=UPI003BA33C7E